jgi:hypothetical protein
MVDMNSKRKNDSVSALSINSMGNKTHKNSSIVTSNKNCEGVLSLLIRTTIE